MDVALDAVGDEKEVGFATVTEVENEIASVREVDPWRRWRFSSCR